jgi:hypothetical protein
MDLTISPEKDKMIKRRSSEILIPDKTTELDKAQFIPFMPNEDD